MEKFKIACKRDDGKIRSFFSLSLSLTPTVMSSTKSIYIYIAEKKKYMAHSYEKDKGESFASFHVHTFVLVCAEKKVFRMLNDEENENVHTYFFFENEKKKGNEKYVVCIYTRIEEI